MFPGHIGRPCPLFHLLDIGQHSALEGGIAGPAENIWTHTATEQILQPCMTHAHVQTRRKNFSAHTTHYLSTQCLKCIDNCHLEFEKYQFSSAESVNFAIKVQLLVWICKARPSCLFLKVLERDYWHRSVFVDLLWIWKCVPKTRNQPLCLTELKSEDIFGELLRT